MDRYQMMLTVRREMDELLTQCGLEPSTIPVRRARLPQRLAEVLGQDQELCGYLNALSLQMEKVSKAMEALRIDLWSMEQDGQRMEALEQSLAHSQQRCAELEQQLEQVHTVQEPRGQMYIIWGLIEIRDRLLMRREWMVDQELNDVDVIQLMEGQLHETGRLLQAVGVEILNGGGRFDHTFQTVVDTCPAPVSEQVGHIAHTVRPGYRRGQDVLRPQEIVLYV